MKYGSGSTLTCKLATFIDSRLKCFCWEIKTLFSDSSCKMLLYWGPHMLTRIKYATVGRSGYEVTLQCTLFWLCKISITPKPQNPMRRRCWNILNCLILIFMLVLYGVDNHRSEWSDPDHNVFQSLNIFFLICSDKNINLFLFYFSLIKF